ncbi:MAG: bifunctional 4-hydroxy-2-oxoglutarate aldolase/2-dehydro-3-deoxy-phosphogluconate aldolase [Dokdonella sp.]|uniref:bifunctional 4-hydroxy-2-oxoglutarate aldolase/2-dehydro-3-deoxy-phosphogluconate aldolase n=1 Tax=Dokdonella sp. TaxID=2291710 RepID=UPI0025C07058|nr:bifunctional 4-hydroxy-2-oxoglutarate aldolase/2-dehydro-3-deoxy-phosphogluconate aldolase [Dokdonella sp.]MBZ0221665.1 bifunctional 4-hydroxy-2-oxoglutarate aldolase/2-dehydro-3-deoxy-phosphogluconate aldolase [Dokdonella sp.]MCC7255739.1 bifunctional 4-hydroxy-2-oxoglutarate aldolase/2-dehydro-3-deoxy-phosphogluconate aldolase [Dokdonella sp.]
MSAMDTRQQQVARILAIAPVIAVVVIDDIAHAVPMARALVAGGIRAIEVTLRTPVALAAVGAIAAEVEGAVTGVGTVLDAAQLESARRAGAHFAVSPGSTPRLLDAAEQSPLPLLPGAATASEAMALLERGYRHLKFFPAVPAGGAKLLAAWAGPLPQLRFCPTGGISAASAGEFLALGNVACVGGSWLTPKDRLAAGDWQAIEQLARAAAQLRG